MTKRNTLSVFIVVIVLALVAAITVLSLYFTGCFSETRDEPGSLRRSDSKSLSETTVIHLM